MKSMDYLTEEGGRGIEMGGLGFSKMGAAEGMGGG